MLPFGLFFGVVYMMSYFIHNVVVVIHQEFGNLGIQNRKGLIMPSADMA
jgi:hypothetical protein